jgi:predicted DCC family thiol-disulfide oxidoreductase YuxK
MNGKILIYDQDCTYCKAFVKLVDRFDRAKSIRSIGYDDVDAQSLLKVQFGTLFGFAMYFFEEEKVSWGREAAENIIKSLAFPRWISKIAFYVYPSFVSIVTKLTNRDRKVCGPECAGAAKMDSSKLNSSLLEETIREIERILSAKGKDSELSKSAP